MSAASGMGTTEQDPEIDGITAAKLAITVICKPPDKVTHHDDPL